MEFIDLKTQYRGAQGRYRRAHPARARPRPVHPGTRGTRARRQARRVHRRRTLHQRGLRHRGAADRADGARHEAGRRSHHHAVHLRCHGRDDRAARRARPVFVDVEPDTGQHRRLAARGGDHAAHAKRSCRCRSTASRPTWTRSTRSPPATSIAVIEDAAQSFGATLQGQEELQPVDDRLHQLLPVEAARLLRRRRRDLHQRRRARHGDARDPRAWPERALRAHPHRRRRAHGHAAVRGRARPSSGRFDWELERRIALGRRYDELLAGVKLASTVRPRPRPASMPSTPSGMPSARGCRRRSRRRAFPTAVHYPQSLHQQPAYAADYRGQSFPVSERLAREVISLPMSADLKESRPGHDRRGARGYLPMR